MKTARWQRRPTFAKLSASYCEDLIARLLHQKEILDSVTNITKNITFFEDAPEYGIPVALKNTGSTTQKNIQREIESFVTEFERRIS